MEQYRSKFKTHAKPKTEQSKGLIKSESSTQGGETDHLYIEANGKQETCQEQVTGDCNQDNQTNRK